ncbi:hypothetical protein RAS1_24150 [Phycisphaerae bacterium RAS1]|nr:hypothetical protein RAS1_24150 [Phycisphaerae bacterium RAS1]
MRRFLTTLLSLGCITPALAGEAMLLWDNYLTPPLGHDRVSGRASERNTDVPDAWTVDDALFDTAVEVRELRWIGLRDETSAYASADVILLDSQFQQVELLVNLPYTATPLEMLLGYEVYEGRVGDLSIELPAGHYYVGARLVDSGSGRNFVATTGNGQIGGLTTGAFRCATFGVPEWTLVGEFATPTDYAYQVYGVPEPAGFVMAAAGALVIVRMRPRG